MTVVMASFSSLAQKKRYSGGSLMYACTGANDS